MIRNRFPDFYLLPWRRNADFRLLSTDGFCIGRYLEFLNEQSGDIGIRFEIDGVDYPVLSWKESRFCGESGIGFRYVAWRDEEGWKKLRVKSHQPDRAERRVFPGGVRISLYFLPVIGEEFPISYSIRI